MVEDGDRDRPPDSGMLTTENASEIVNLFSGVRPSDVDRAAQLLNQIWVKSNSDNSTSVLILKQFRI